MIGTVSRVFVDAIRDWALVPVDNISVVLANDNGEGTVNTALPAVAVAVKGTEDSRTQWIGGMIEQDYVVQLIVITNFDNQAASPDLNHQYNMMDLSYKLMLYINSIKNGPLFEQLMKDYDFSINFRGVETEQTRGMENEMEIEVFVHRLVYLCKFVSKESSIEPGEILPEDGIDMNCLCETQPANSTITYTGNVAKTNINGKTNNTI